MLPVIAITPGDPAGIGPEVIMKALSKPKLLALARFVLIGSKQLFQTSLAGMVAFDFNGIPETTQLQPNTKNIGFLKPESKAGHDLILSGRRSSGKTTGFIAGSAIKTAIALARANLVDAIVTAPISKEAINLAGFNFPGHTEFLAHHCGAEVVMMLMCSTFRVALASGHCPLSQVTDRLSVSTLVRTLKIVDRDLKTRFKIPAPIIAVAGLNPHSGENGLLGAEEKEIIIPAIEVAQRAGIRADGPFPADTLFCALDKKPFDVYLAMYHDQGLIPLKMLSFGHGVNYTAGLPFIRTSPDHGTAIDIAGQGIADSGSMEEAIKLAVKLAA